ncbi:response regulator [Plasticicumulans acidivorans]|uniref:Response regulator receiver domain-containing protein n=1 Tax=Plasticicumulans acidivorans TaxID=886464 RepID=A0A317MTD8_9GAMM|nr:response regulator [Plasticicumulans acidivorans]PWV60558.1 response regulator receiver domain-containing protein [Plasticicumulans acidivorans]
MKTALVVDDSRLARLALTRTLEKHGLQVAQVASAAEAFEYLNSTRPDLVFMDVTMPEMDGFTAAGLIHNDPRSVGIPVIMCSAEETADVKARAADVGAVAFLSKTADDAGISQLLGTLLRAAPAPQAAPVAAAAPALDPAALQAQIAAAVDSAVAARQPALEAQVRESLLAGVPALLVTSLDERLSALLPEIGANAVAQAREVAASHAQASAAAVAQQIVAETTEPLARAAAESVLRDATAEQAAQLRTLIAEQVPAAILASKDEWLQSLQGALETGPFAVRIGELARGAASEAVRAMTADVVAQVQGMQSNAPAEIAALRNELEVTRRAIEQLPTRAQLDEAVAEARAARELAEEAQTRLTRGMVVLALGVVAALAVSLML